MDQYAPFFASIPNKSAFEKLASSRIPKKSITYSKKMGYQNPIIF